MQLSFKTGRYPSALSFGTKRLSSATTDYSLVLTYVRDVSMDYALERLSQRKDAIGKIARKRGAT